MKKEKISTGSKWEPIIGYSRAVKVGPHIHVSGTTSSNEKGEFVGAGDVYAQTVQIIKNIKSALARVGASLEDVVRTRIFTTKISDWEKIGKAHGEFFGEIRPATTMVEVSKLIGDEILVEIEAEAILEDS